MEEKNVRDVVRPYVVDGIEEYDNPLPPWWVWMFILCSIFGFVYLVWVHGFGWNQIENELKLAEEKHAALIQANGQIADAAGGFEQRFKDPALVVEGKDVFAANCAPCHGTDGGGIVGPNLTDVYWLHGGSPKDVLKIVTDGVVDKGMLAWGPILGPKKVEAVTAYVLSLQGSSPKTPKAPQGEEYKP